LVRIGLIRSTIGILSWVSMVIGWSMLFCTYPIEANAKHIIELQVFLEPPNPPSTIPPPTNLRVVSDISTNQIERFRVLFNNGGPRERADAAKELYDMEYLGSEYVPLLAEQLKNDDPFVRRAVAGRLARFGPNAYPAITPLIEALQDNDQLTRLNALAALGRIGGNAGYAAKKIVGLLYSKDPQTRAYALGALANIGPSASAAIPEIQELLRENINNSVILNNSIIALGRVGPEAFITIPDLLNLWEKIILHSQKVLIAETLAEIAKNVQDSDAIESLPQIEQAKVLLANSHIGPEIEESLKTVERAYKYLKLREKRSDKPNDQQTKVAFADAVPEELIGQNQIVINGATIPITEINQGEHSVFLGIATDIIKKGLNILDVGKTRLYYWREHILLQNFQNPYKRSYAIIAAIDDYDRKKNNNGVGPTGLPLLGSMVSGGRELAATLVKLGFPKANIFEFYDKNATSDNLDKILKEFWAGANYEKADRLFFYFGGHGAVNGNSAYLVPKFCVKDHKNGRK
jgi:hypothetical protein